VQALSDRSAALGDNPMFSLAIFRKRLTCGAIHRVALIFVRDVRMVHDLISLSVRLKDNAGMK
jgi:hypothetical protein